MEEIILYIYKKYGVLLSKDEVEIVIEWYRRNSNRLTNEDILDSEIRSFLLNTFKGRKRHVFAEDTSNMKYLLTLLKAKSNNEGGGK